MNLVLFQPDAVMLPSKRLLVSVLQHPLLAAMLELYHKQISDKTLCVLPMSMASDTRLNGDICQYSATEPIIASWMSSDVEPVPWICISHGAHIDLINEARVALLLSHTEASVVCLGADERLAGHREQIRYASDGSIVGFRRYYEDSVLAVPPFEEWPHRVYIRSDCVSHFASLPLRFKAFDELCEAHDLQVQSFSVAGSSYDLNTAQGQMELVKFINRHDEYVQAILESVRGFQCISHDKAIPGRKPRVVGKVWLSTTSEVSPDAVLISPVVVSEKVRIQGKALLESSLVSANVHVEGNTIVSQCIFDGHQDACQKTGHGSTVWDVPSQQSRFRQWSGWAYINTLKRAVDIAIALIVVVLFFPIFPGIALAIKINSPGPVFYKAKRQGLYGKEFDCLKFRTMKVGADQLQDKLRAINEVDGPQFKMADDPRISAVGHFLRETYLDEIPQFLNVLKGDMSLVGPRPSPKSENTQCPRWRDARLSVRPGITGLWQLLRTREPLRDFQEWIHYDIDYIKRVSARLDIWICWKTFLQMLGKFGEQF
jgi:lipopolysaccharide/colanic/teichoic acid biosynthesis glycosyltransferase